MRMAQGRNFRQILLDFVVEMHGNDLRALVDRHKRECPSLAGCPDEETAFQIFFDWFIFERRQPEHGRIIAETYVERHPELDEGMRKAIQEVGDVVASQFIVLRKKAEDATLKDRKTGRTYAVRFPPGTRGIGPNTLLEGRLHRFGSHYEFIGRVFARHTPFILDRDVMLTAFMDDRIRAAESLIIAPYTTLTAALNKYPSNWVDGICVSLGLDKGSRKPDKAKMIREHLLANMAAVVRELPAESLEALRLILSEGGRARLGKLGAYDGEITFFWESQPPTSALGSLRVRGLLVIGQAVESGRKYKTALVPSDIRGALGEALHLCENGEAEGGI